MTCGQKSVARCPNASVLTGHRSYLGQSEQAFATRAFFVQGIITEHDPRHDERWAAAVHDLAKRRAVGAFWLQRSRSVILVTTITFGILLLNFAVEEFGIFPRP